ncbi:gephyrin-like molybdotransferase Glp [Thermococcus sp. Bubb.Bath]|uniref:molybdenum cofactor synthesis domain-containing protein n=1 Tax=Thermococcus sp. Bubb.Bath TaxID=1638242 RepID=UPI00143B8AE3|nr:gephyrin-like molybdotransferase Glp [Thermococcus sp. Bubb.Bath]NJF25377.1 molybdopterin molybdenumtransferase MoeA [Thermococcus sp. Bubb.Bath]
MAFLKVVPLEKAREILNSFGMEPKTEEVPLEDALGRVLAEDVVSPIDVPPFDRATFDGYAVRAEDTFMASEAEPVRLRVIGEVHAGDFPDFALDAGTCAYISTGAPLPQGADAVIQFEDVEREGDEVVIFKPAYPGLDVVKRGVDVPKGKLVLEKGTRLGFKETALLSAVGLSKVKVYRKPRVAVISTGSEIVLPGEELKPGEIYDINGRAVSDAIRELGGEACFLGVARDDEKRVAELILKGISECDMVLLSGGASGGMHDLTSSVIERLGQLYIHGIAIQPGKPTIIGQIDGKPVIGLPGKPTSCLTNFTLLVAPLLRKLLGRETEVRKIRKKLAHKVFSVKGRRQFLPVKIDGDRAVPILKGSDVVTSFVDANGFIEVPENVEILEAGEEVEVTLFG